MMISRDEVLAIHDILLSRFGGRQGVRDEGLLDSAINRPFQTFDGKELYPSAIDKAAAVFESVVTNHPFIDGNKRTAYVLMRLVLRESNLSLVSDEDDKYDFVILAASGKISFKEIRDWIASRLQ
jgi:death-on-curing protein